MLVDQRFLPFCRPLLNRLESVGGKAALKQQAIIENSRIADTLARQEAGLRPQDAITKTNLEAARDTIAVPYQQVAQLPPQPLTKAPFRSAADTLEELRQARFEAKRNFDFYRAMPNPEIQDKAFAFQKKADQLEQTLEAVASQSGKPDLVDAVRKARQSLAKNYDVERAMNVGSGSIDPAVIGNALDRNAKLSGGLEKIGRFQQQYPQFMGEATRTPTPGVSKSEAIASAVLGTGGAAVAGPPGVLAGGMPLLSGPARAMALSPWYQRLMAQPNYSAGPMTRELSGLADPASREKLAALLRALSTPAAMTYQQGSQ